MNLTANYKISEKIDVGASWEFYTGGTTTLGGEKTFTIKPPEYSNGFIYISSPQGYLPNTSVSEANYISGRNNYRLPPSHRLNIGINFHKRKKYGERIWNISIFNVYNAMNPTFIYRDAEYDESASGGTDNSSYLPMRQVIRKITILPIIPSFTYTYKF
ncbi:MAG: hypothetical protein LBJ47_03780 [Tannerella sp.]|nr:hypothetical protein [Tannerella sp.]